MTGAIRNWLERPSEIFSWFDPYYRAIAVAVALFLACFVTYTAWDFARITAYNDAYVRFEFRATQTGEAIRGRMGDYEQVLRGGAGLFAASASVARGEWRTYVEHLRLQEMYPGIEGLGVLRRVAAADKVSHEQAIAAEMSSRYAIQPAGERPVYFPVVYIEPFSGRNLRAFGFDLYSEETRRAAMDQARDSGEPVLSGKVVLVQESERDVQAGVLMFVPLYRRELDSPTVVQRRLAHTGYVYGAFRMNDLIAGILGKLPGVRVQLFDGGSGAPGALLFDSAPEGVRHQHRFAKTVDLPMRGRNWTLRVTSLPGFEETVDRHTPQAVGLLTGLISALVLGIVWSLATMRARAVWLARAMTRELRDSRERLALAVEGSNQALFDWDVVTGKVVLSEQWGRIIGGGHGGLTTTIAELQAMVHPDDLSQVRRQSADLVRGQILFYQVEHRVRTLSGGWRWISSRAKVVDRDPMGRAVRVAGTNLDITERKEIERLKNEFIATVSHELRTPLTAIIGSLGLLKELAAGRLPAEAEPFMGMAQQNSERLAVLINDILDIEKIESGQMEFRAEALQVGPLLERAVELNAPYAERHGVRFELLRPLPQASVLADGDRLLQVLTNLMSNAAKFSPAGAAVTVSGAARDGRVRVSVTDRGPGVPEEFRGRIFQKFAQADSSDTRRKGGTGLGLAISKALVEKMGGTIGFETEAGKGSTFYFELPARA